MPRIQTIKLPLPSGMGSVNCCLIETETVHLLIDTGPSRSRRAQE